MLKIKIWNGALKNKENAKLISCRKAEIMSWNEVTTDNEDTSSLDEWIDQHINGEYFLGKKQGWIKDNNEAMHFKLVWGGNNALV